MDELSACFVDPTRVFQSPARCSLGQRLAVTEILLILEISIPGAIWMAAGGKSCPWAMSWRVFAWKLRWPVSFILGVSPHRQEYHCPPPSPASQAAAASMDKRTHWPVPHPCGQNAWAYNRYFSFHMAQVLLHVILRPFSVKHLSAAWTADALRRFPLPLPKRGPEPGP